jgi:hypothetical protein
MGVAAWALVISCVAAVIALAALVWQIVSYQRAGPAATIHYATMDVSKGTFRAAVSNSGRLDIQVREIWVEQPPIMPPGSPHGLQSTKRTVTVEPSLPFTLKVGHLELFTALSLPPDMPSPSQEKSLYAVVELGNYRSISASIDERLG